MKLETFRRMQRSENTRYSDILSTAAGPTTISGRFTVFNSGEAFKTILFPVKFTNIPVLTFGFEVEGYNSLHHRREGGITAKVYDWEVVDRPPVSRLYSGANIVITSTGLPVMRFNVLWSAEGVAFSGMGASIVSSGSVYQ